MTVSITISKTLGGAQIADALAGGGAGLDLGSVVNSEYCPIINQAANTGFQRLYIRHDAAIDPIRDVRTWVAEYSQDYGGADTAADDIATLLAKGAASGNSSNNGDGNSAGLRIEQEADLAETLGMSAFDGTRARVRIYGRDYGAGIDGSAIDKAFPADKEAMILDDSGTPVLATTPVDGEIGKDGDTVLGDNYFVKMRYYLESAPPAGGILQADWVLGFSYTAALFFSFVPVISKLVDSFYIVV